MIQLYIVRSACAFVSTICVCYFRCSATMPLRPAIKSVRLIAENRRELVLCALTSAHELHYSCFSRLLCTSTLCHFEMVAAISCLPFYFRPPGHILISWDLGLQSGTEQ